MARDERKALNARNIEAMQVGDVLWDGAVRGLYISRRREAGGRHYAIKVRIGGRQRHIALGQHGSPLTPDMARKAARQRLGEIAAGTDLAAVRDHNKSIPTVGNAWDRFMTQHVSMLKNRSGDQYEFMGRLHILPAIGKSRIDAIEPTDISKLHHKMRDAPVTANRTVAALSKFFSWCERNNLRKRNTNPCVGHERFREQKRDRFLDDNELSRLGDALANAEAMAVAEIEAREKAAALGRRFTSFERAKFAAAEDPFFIALVRLLILTGARHNEVKTLKWSMVDEQRGLLVLPDSKTGAKTIVLNSAARQVLATIPRVEGNDHVIVGEVKGAHLVNALKPWMRICKTAGLDGVRLHDLRHSHASVAAARGGSLIMIGRLLGHSRPETTARYAHLQSDPLRALADETGSAIDTAMNRNRLTSADVVTLPQKAGRS